jgi:hypothetical protein
VNGRINTGAGVLANCGAEALSRGQGEATKAPLFLKYLLRCAAVWQVIGMYQTLLGRAGFRKGMDLYFQRHDGTAVTCDDFRAAMADANCVDLTQFERWYTQAGTPQVKGDASFDFGIMDSQTFCCR